MNAGSNAPTIIKRKKVIAGGGHHGGAWKVAIIYGPSIWRFAPGWIEKSQVFYDSKRHSDGNH